MVVMFLLLAIVSGNSKIRFSNLSVFVPKGERFAALRLLAGPVVGNSARRGRQGRRTAFDSGYPNISLLEAANAPSFMLFPIVVSGKLLKMCL